MARFYIYSSLVLLLCGATWAFQAETTHDTQHHHHGHHQGTLGEQQLHKLVEIGTHAHPELISGLMRSERQQEALVQEIGDGDPRFTTTTTAAPTVDYGAKSLGWCVSGSGAEVKKHGHGYTVVKDEPSCWALCKADVVQGCAYHFATKNCMEYDGEPGVRPMMGNGMEGFVCRINELAPADKDVSKTYGMTSNGFLPPQCAATCPIAEGKPKCATYREWIATGACAGSCGVEIKKRGEEFFCAPLAVPDAPPCVATCPTDEKPSCSAYKKHVSVGGCGETCSKETRDVFEPFFCGPVGVVEKPPCASTCPLDEVPSCDSFKKYTSAGGCAASCTMAVKDQFETYFCPTKWPDVPPCATTCPQDVGPSCEVYKKYAKDGGCAAGCSEKVKGQFDKYFCPAPGGDSNGWNPAIAANAPRTMPHTLQQAEAEVKKLDKVVEGAEGEAGLPDTTHTTPTPDKELEDEDDEENEKQLMWVALGMIALCCAWSVAWGVFYKRFTTPTKEKLLDETEDQGEETHGEDQAEAEHAGGWWPF